MDYLPLPSKLNKEALVVPYVGREQYDGLPFLHYPQRKGYQKLRSVPASMEYVPLQPKDWNENIELEEEEAFLQTWLLFGLLHEMQKGIAKVKRAIAKAHEARWTMPDGLGLVSFECLDSELKLLYETLTYEIEGFKYITTAHLMAHLAQSISEPDEEVEDIENKKSSLQNLSICLRHAASALIGCSENFNKQVKSSIAVIGESLMHFLAPECHSFGLDLPYGLWATGFFTAALQDEMIRSRGWCRSEIFKCMNSHDSVHMAWLLSQIDKSRPKRDHSRCTDARCLAGQIDMGNYKVGHVSECNCKLLEVDSFAVTRILEKGELIPILQLSGNEKNGSDLTCEVIESASNAQYVALSHVWADGLGNPEQNALYSCQLAQIRDLVPNFTRVRNFDGTLKPVLLWIDTLCCPVTPPEAKKIALKKIRTVYENASYVLVLDAGIREYPALPATPFENLIRIQCSNWMRRLWTLQEAALAKVLLFQFQDAVVPLDLMLGEVMKKFKYHILHRGLIEEVQNELVQLRTFFHADDYSQPRADLTVLDLALKYRSVTVPSDEPICVGTLMALEPSAIVPLQGEDAMAKVWSLLADANAGISSSIVFFPEKRLTTPGFRWAPASFLGFAVGLATPITRSATRRSPRAVAITPNGIKVRFPGFHLRVLAYDDGLPRDPWPGSLRRGDGAPAKLLELLFTHFRTSDDKWYHFSKQDTPNDGRIMTDETDRAWKTSMTHPLEDLVSSGRCPLICRELPKSQDNPSTSASMGLIVKIIDEADTQTQHDNSAPPLELRVRAEGHILVSRVRSSWILVLQTLSTLATQLRASELTKKLCAIAGEQGIDSEEYKESMDQLKTEMQRLVRKAKDENPEIVKGIREKFPERKSMDEGIWKLLADWYRHDTFTGEVIPDSQVWVVD